MGIKPHFASFEFQIASELMQHVQIVMPPEASKQVQGVYEEFHQRMSFPSPPNFIMTQGHSYAVARGTWELVRNVLVTGEIPRVIKEIIFVAISKDRDCRYCTAAHIACCRMLGVDAVTMDRVASDVELIPDPKLREMLLFALKCSRIPQSMEEIDFNRLRKLGMKESEIIELVAMSALSVYANIIADATAMHSDEVFRTLQNEKRVGRHMTKFSETRLRNLLSKQAALCLDRNETYMLKRLLAKKRKETETALRYSRIKGPL